ncbi:MAG: hypothetical protein AAF974_05010, partial [Cyanobacteria bacterium P01_E01_bin.34]
MRHGIPGQTHAPKHQEGTYWCGADRERDTAEQCETDDQRTSVFKRYLQAGAGQAHRIASSYQVPGVLELGLTP